MYCIVALFLFVCNSNAQKSINEELRSQYSRAMISFIESVKPAFVKGQTFTNFENNIIGNSQNTPEGNALLNKAFEFLSNEVSNKQILLEYSGIEMENAEKLFNRLKLQNPNINGIELFGGSSGIESTFMGVSKLTGCKWYQFNCFIQNTF